MLSPFKQFSFELRGIVQRQPLPGYVLTLEHAMGRERLSFVPTPEDSFDAALRHLGFPSVDNQP